VTTVREAAAFSGNGATEAGAAPLRVALVTCTEHADGEGMDPVLTDALTEHGADVRWVIWTDGTVDWSSFDLVVIRSTWDYPGRIDDFRAWVVDVAMSSTLLNPPRLVLDNLHKGYLSDLDDAVPTLVVPAGMTVDVAHFGWPAAVVKPAVGVGGDGVVRGATQADLDALTLAGDGGVDVVVQPYLEGIEQAGEVSIVCVEGEPTHAVRKRPAPGEFRIHAHRGGTVESEPLTDRLRAVARRALASLPVVPAYGRVDVIEHGDQLLVVELELVEPYLWFDMEPAAADRLAAGLMARARAGAR
jgi:glutathione synthase/RimK-type ligase-like ATP-grasp enzyme